MPATNLRIDRNRFLGRLEALARIGGTPEGGVQRMALTDADKAGRDQLVAWLRQAGLTVHIDRIGNIVGVLPGETDLPPLMMGSHIDTVAHGGKYDGVLGVLAGLEVIETIRDSGVRPNRGLAVAAFTNEEGARFQPDMLGSYVWSGTFSVEDSYAIRDSEGKALGDELRRIGYAGPDEPGFLKPCAYLELHIEQGPVLDAEGGGIGAVTGVQAIWWSEVTIEGEANHAGTTPMSYRRSAAMAAAELITFAERLALEIPGTVANCGTIVFEPGNVNVVPRRAVFTLDIRNPDDASLSRVEARLAACIAEVSARRGVGIVRRDLARFAAQPFDEQMIGRVETAAAALGLPVRRMVSGAGHDAQALAPQVPTAMIFVPSVKGISHNPEELTGDDDLVAGANVLLATALDVVTSA